MSRTKVVVTGMGTTSPLGGDVASTWDGMLNGRSGVRHLSDEWAEEMPVKIAGRVAVEPTDVLERVRARRLDRSSQLALVAAMEAWRDSGLEGSDVDGDRVGVAMASGIGGVTTLLDNHDILRAKGPRRVSPLAVPMLMPNAAAANISLYVGARAAVNTPVSACASGNEGIALAVDQIRLGRADVVLAGGTEAAIHPLPIAGFTSMRALSTRNDSPETASRPYDLSRDGFVLGEGAGVVVLESEEHARGRGARVYAELVSAGLTSDAHHIAAPDPVGAGAIRAMRAALAEGGLDGSDVVHINAHATSTPAGDTAEAAAITAVLGDHVASVAVSATKSMTGHLLGAAGAVEGIFCILALHHGQAPPTTNLQDQDPAIILDVVTGGPRDIGPGVALNNSFGFGGHNAAVAFRSAS